VHTVLSFSIIPVLLFNLVFPEVLFLIGTTRLMLVCVQIVVASGGWDGERGTVTSGGRGYYLMGGAVLLQQALIQFSLHMLAR
jgi:hypothetical protein